MTHVMGDLYSDRRWVRYTEMGDGGALQIKEM